MPIKTRNSEHLEHSTRASAGTKQPASNHQPTSSATLPRRPPSPDSIQKARTKFQKFSLSKFARHSVPSNYLHVEKKKTPPPDSTDDVQHVHEFQRKKIEKQLHDFARSAEHDARKGGPAARAGITVALPKKNAKNFLPSYHHEKRTVDLGELIRLIERHAAGTSFYMKGHPTLNRLMVRAQAQKFMAKIGIGKKGKKAGA